jgi:hypothetical protein
MNMIAHPAIGVQVTIVSIQPCGNKPFQCKAINIVIQNILAVVAA